MGLQFARLVALLLRDCSSPFAQGLPAASPDKSKRGRESDDESGMGKRARGRRVVSSDEEGGETGGSEVRRARRIDGSDEEDEPQSAGAL